MHLPGLTSTPPRTRRRRGLALAAGAVAVAIALSACGTSSASTSSSSSAPASFGALSVQLSWIKNVEFAGEYYADSKGYYTDAGFDSVNLIAGPGATESLVASGQAMVGVTDPISVAPAIVNEGAPIKIIGTTYQKNPFSIVSLADKANITTPKDMIGKRIGVQAGNETLFSALLAVNGIDPSQVTVVPVEYDPSPLINGDVDGFLGYITNEAIIVSSQGYKVTNLPYADNGLPFVTESFIASQTTIDNDREALKAFLYASIKGWQDALADPQGSADLATNTYGKDLGLDPAVQLEQAKAATELISTPDTTANGLFTITDALIQKNLDVIKSSGVTISADQLFDLSLLSEVYAAHPELIK